MLSVPRLSIGWQRMAKDCAECGNPDYYMVEVPGVYDGGLYFWCPVCNHKWHRFEPHHYLWHKADPYVTGEKDD